MSATKFKGLFSRLNNTSHMVKEMHDELVTAEERIGIVEKERDNYIGQLADNAMELKRLSDIIEEQQARLGESVMTITAGADATAE